MAGMACDKCGWKWNITNTRIKKKREGEQEITWFSCPKCGEKYIVSVTDETIRNNIQRIRAMGMIRNPAENGKKQREKLRKDTQEAMERLKKTYLEGMQRGPGRKTDDSGDHSDGIPES